MDMRDLYPVRSTLPDHMDWCDVGASLLPVDLFCRRLLDPGHIRVLMDRKLHMIDYFQMITFSSQDMGVISMKITTEMSELMVAPLVL